MRTVVTAFIFLIVIFVPVIAVAAAVTVIVVFIIVPLRPDPGIVVAVCIVLRVIWHIRIFAAATAVLVARTHVVVIPDIVYCIRAVIRMAAVAVGWVSLVMLIPGAGRILG